MTKKSKNSHDDQSNSKKMIGTYYIELISKDENDPPKDISAKTVVEAINDEEALRKAKIAIKTENPEFNIMRVWFWNIEKRPLT